MDSRGLGPGGVGEESALSGIAAVEYAPSDAFEFAFLVGFNMAGRVRVDDPAGNILADQSYDVAFFGGVSVSVRF